MGFFNILESAFFVSLAITFVLVIMLVYHFKERLVSLEKKNDTMFQILNRVVKELKAMQDTESQIDIDMNRVFSSHPSSCPVNMFSMFSVDSCPPKCNIEHVDDSESEDSDSCDEVEDEVKVEVEVEVIPEELPVREEDIKVINIGSASVKSLNDIDENSDNESTDDDEEDEKSIVEPEDAHIEVSLNEPEIVEEVLDTLDDDLDKPVDYKRMEVSYLRELAVSRGLATDPKRLKKGELIKLLTDE